MSAIKEFCRRHWLPLLSLFLLFVLATALLIAVSGDSQEGPFVYILR